MSDEVPKLPGEVFRGEIMVRGEPWLVCIAPGVEVDDGPALRAWRWLPHADPLPKMSRWRERAHSECAPVFAQWALHERDVAAAERGLRQAQRAHGGPAWMPAGEVWPAGCQPFVEALRKLGREP